MRWPALPLVTLLVAAFSTLAGCGSTESSTSSSGGTTASSSGAGSSSGSSGGAGNPCVDAGGVCGCAGGCNPGYHAASPPLLDQCPQPCDLCGACGQQCCLPDTDAGSDAGDAG